jgi:hypothetical protein
MAGDTSGELQIATNGSTTAVTVNASQNVGIGTTSPTRKLDVVISGTGDQNIVSVATSGAGGQGLILGVNTTSSVTTIKNSTSASYGMAFLSSDGTAESMRIDSSNSLLIGSTSNLLSAKVFIPANSSTKNAIVIQDTGVTYGAGQWFQVFANSSGTVAGSIAHTAVTTTAYQTSSDKRLKENIENSSNTLSKVLDIKVRSFDWKEDESHVDYGFIAQELYDVFPEVVGKGDDTNEIDDPKGVWQVEYGRLTPVLVKAIQEQQTIINDLKARITALEGAA